MATVPHAEAINKLVKPANMHYDTWRQMRRLLRMLSSYGDDIYPSQRTLASKLGLSLATVNRLVLRAEVEGWIIRTEQTSPGRGRAVTRYQICLPFMFRNGTNKKELPTGVLSEAQSSSRTGRCLAAQPPRRISLAERMGKVVSNRYHGTCYVCQRPVRAREGILHGIHPIHPDCVRTSMDRNWQRQQAEDFNGPSTFGEDPQTPLVGHGPTITNPAAKLAYQFDRVWHAEVLRRRPEWRKYRCIHLGPAIGYIKSQFLAKGYSPDYVEAYFDAYFDELTDLSSTLMMRDGQTVWQLFTGWWGSVEIPDPAIEQEAQQVRDAVHDILTDDSARRSAAWDRIMAADEPDPEDWKIVRGRA